MYKHVITSACPISPNSVKNSTDFINQIKNIKVPKNYIMASFDIESMFNSIPIQLVLKSIKKRWEKIKKFTKLPQNEFLKGLDVLMNSLFFKYDDKYYKQVNGLPMGLSISPIIADIVIQDIEEHVLSKYKNYIVFYRRYVDDSCIILNKRYLKNILDSFNNFNDRINFTHEIELCNQINFLDTLIIRDEHGHLSFDIYKKRIFQADISITILLTP